VIREMRGTGRLMAMLLCGSGLRLMECCHLRVKDVDLDRRELLVRHGKGGHDGVTMLPESLVAPLDIHLATPALAVALRRHAHVRDA